MAGYAISVIIMAMIGLKAHTRDPGVWEIGENMIWQLMERLNDNPAAILLLPLSIICLGGAIPLMREHSRRRSIERALPEMLELISAELGAGLVLNRPLQMLPNPGMTRLVSY